MMTAPFGRLLRFAAAISIAALAVGCASSQGPGQITAPAGYGKDTNSRVERLVQYCDRLTEKGELVTALGLCARAHEIDPDNPETLMKMATILQSLNRRDAAIQTYGVLLERHPRHHEAQYRIGKLYMETGDAGLASIHFDRAIQSRPEDPRPYNALGILRDQAGEHDAAQGLYRLALERDPGNHSVRNNLGLSLALNGKRDEAIEVLAELAVDPEAGQTVLRNLEAAYAARPPARTDKPDMPVAEPTAVQPPAEPAAEAGPPPLDTATKKPADGMPEAPEAAAPTPLFLRPDVDGDTQQQSHAERPQAEPGDVSDSVILAAAERLMQPPEWADFEPGDLLSEQPPQAPKTPPQSSGLGEISVDPMELGGGFWPQDNGFAMLLLRYSIAMA